MNYNKKQGEFLLETIEEWQKRGTINNDTAEKLKSEIQIRPFDWMKLAIYAFWIAMICIIISVATALKDNCLIELITELFTSSNTAICIGFIGIAAGLYAWGLNRRKNHPQNLFSNETIFLGGVLATAVAVGYFGKVIDNGSGHFSMLFLLSTFIYAGLGFWFPSTLVWIFAVLSFGTWFGTETGYVSGWGAYFIGMNYPMRFVLFGLMLTIASFFIPKKSKLDDFQHPTYVLGLLYLFISLWILSIFGNYGDMDSWYHVKQIELFHWGILFAGAAILAIWYGLKQDDYTSRSFGITFLFINLYTKFFEYFWDSIHKAVFFLILAVSFWFLGQKAEKIWNLEFLKGEKKE